MNAARRASHFLTTSWSLCYCKFTATLRSGLATWLPVHPSRSNRCLPTAKTALKHSPSWQVMLHTRTHSMGMQLKAWYIGVKPSEARTGALWSVYSAESAPPQCEQTPIWSVSRGHLHRGHTATEAATAEPPLPVSGGCRRDRPLSRASCRRLCPCTKTTTRHLGEKEEPLWAAQRTAAASSLSASSLRE